MAPTDLLDEGPITMNQARALLPGNPHPATIWRWFTRGVRGVKLETLVSGGRRYTTRQAVERFVRRTTAASPGADRRSKPSNRRQEAVRRAERNLAADGI